MCRTNLAMFLGGGYYNWKLSLLSGTLHGNDWANKCVLTLRLRKNLGGADEVPLLWRGALAVVAEESPFDCVGFTCKCSHCVFNCEP